MGLIPCSADVGADLGRSDPGAGQCVAVFFLDTPTGRWAAWASVFVVSTNIPIMLIEGGMSRLMAVPHLLAWGPLVVMLFLRLANPHVGSAPSTASESALMWALLLVNSVSLCFDTLDTWRWCRGERDIPGRIPHERL
ncbi:hypothetical protein [Alcaligenes sp. SMD-FA]|uniref:hypothetical protein n=1 Tax=Alcaligenes sp. SMD-FA TaxID=2991054 RepID=UPI0022274798|nr:hypothetical protein [Alcaligenes sp. SMD-FA]UYY86337.1 hypothetical protein OKX01_13620 [Alcaligenes sp. SMD-FA]